MTDRPRTRLVIVDDQVLFAQSLKVVLENLAEDIEVVGTAANGREAISLVEQSRPDVVLMDVRMPEMDGVEATRIIHERSRDIKVIVLTTFKDDDYVVRALRYGAVGYLLKTIPPAELVDAIRSVRNQVVLVTPSIAERLARLSRGGMTGDVVEPSNREEVLALYRDVSNREREVLSLVAQAYDNKEIASRLDIAEQTVKNHVSMIYCKLGIADRLAAIRLVNEIPEIRNELLPP